MRELGYLAVAMLQELQVPGLFAVIVLLTLIGLTLYTLIAQLRGWLTPGTLPWRVSPGIVKAVPGNAETALLSGIA